MKDYTGRIKWGEPQASPPDYLQAGKDFAVMCSNVASIGLPEFKWKSRVCWSAGDRSTAYTRNNSFPIEKQASFKEKDPYPSALEYLLGALGGDIAAGFQAVAAKSGVSIFAMEVTISGQLNNALVLLGVIGESGDPGIKTIEGRVYIEADTDEETLYQLWEQVQQRSPLFNTLKRAVDLKFELVITI